MDAEPEFLESDFRHPPLRIEIVDVARRLAELGSQAWAHPLRNPHHEPPVPEEVARSAEPAGVLLPLVERADGAKLILTRRPDHISYGGHICFPGGRADPEDADTIATALRETEEEIGLSPARVTILGRLGDYTTQRGVRITPVVGLVDAEARLTPAPGEVDAIFEIPLAATLDARAYRLVRRPDGPDGRALSGRRGIFVFELPGVTNRAPRLADLGDGSGFISGPTVALMMGFYETLLLAEPRQR